ncbi:MAG: hypothetical protein ACHQ15_05785, partial [Candidatus Limnocylindrales bacterium]
AEWLDLTPTEQARRVPYVLAVDGEDVLRRLVVDARLMRAVQRARVTWRRLQALGGIHDPYAERLLATERAAWEAERAAELAVSNAAPSSPTAVAGETPAATPAATTAAIAEAPDAAPAPLERSPDEPYIETSRCSSCNECTAVNDRLFAYNENKQAYLADLGAGTYRDLVQAAENCQLSIIHPGKPRDPKEPGLDELIKRAEPFI